MRRAQVLEVLRAFEPLHLPVGSFRPSAVLAPLRPLAHDPEALEMVLTRRTTDLTAHAGQVSFPGGRIEEADGGAEAAALRELQEELGVAARDVTVVGHLDHMLTVTGYHITPVVGVLAAGLELRPEPREVARVFAVPLDRLLDDAGWELREHHWNARVFHSWHFLWDGEDVWGATARMLRGFIELLWARSSTAGAGAPAAE
jgi:8-oxo-dGTP pyrophosphatase MutT (NUDIX family)